jgi:hypothetical protein
MKKKSAERNTEIGQHIKAEKIVSALLRRQQVLALFFGKCVGSLNAATLKICLFTFCLVSLAFSIHIAFQPFLSGVSKNNYLKITPVQSPAHFNKSGDVDPQPTPAISETDFMKIQSFISYMDSLSKSKQGIIIRDSILLIRPGLMDSVLTIKTLYYSQKKSN